MNLIKPSLAGAICISVFALQGCFPVYRASLPNQPIMKEKGDIEISSGIETGSGYGRVSYAFSNHAYATVGAQGWSSQNSNSMFAEGGFGLFNTKEKTGIAFSAIGGYGQSSVFNPNWTSVGFLNWVASTPIDATYSRVSVQPALYYHKTFFDFSMILRNSYVYWLSPKTIIGQTPGLDIYLEPAMSFRFGPPATKFFIDGGLQIPVQKSFQHSNAPIHLGLGVEVMFGKKINSGNNQIKTEQ